MNIYNSFDFSNIVPSCFYVVNRYCDDSWAVPVGTRNFHNFMLVVSGSGTSITDGEEIEMRPNMLFYHHAGQSFGYETSKPDYMHVFGVNFYVHSIYSEDRNSTVNTIDKLPFNTFNHMSDMEILCKYFTNLCDIWSENKINYQLKGRSIFSNIFYEISRQLIMQNENAHTIQAVENTITYIRKNYNKQITLDALANISGFNPTYFGSLFKKYTNYTPIEYINNVKIEKAEEYLSIGYSVTETSSLVGFSDPFYFSKVFKKHKGVSPREFIKTPSSFY